VNFYIRFKKQFINLETDFFSGDYVINSAVEPLPAYTFGVRQINVHPYFKFTPQADRFDVAVLQLERPVHFMPHIGN
jgi:transmembrane protease serine 6